MAKPTYNIEMKSRIYKASEREEEGKVQKKREEKKKESDEKNKPEETKKDKDNPKVEAMEEEVPDEAGRGTIKRARTAKSESEEDPNDEVATLKEVITTMSARFQIAEDQMAKKDEENERLRAEIKKMSNRPNPLVTGALRLRPSFGPSSN
uniref:Interactor of constitutive active ROPs 4-like n=1 Tax=Diabrotica virgifera virgifera TaxID=50390 RepID=A0A6P7GK48_DIAVI